jgi:hypothetical protein
MKNPPIAALMNNLLVNPALMASAKEALASARGGALEAAVGGCLALSSS